MEFHANLPIEYFKVFTATIDLFLQFSELVNIDVRNNQLIMSTLNHSRTAQALVRFSPKFFQEYKLLRKGSTETSIQCTVLNKSLNSILKKNFGSIASVKMCHISIVPGRVDDEGHVASKMTMQLVYKNDSKKTNTLSYTDGDSITALYNTDNLHHFVMSTENIRDCFSRFDPRVSDILLKCTPHSITVSTYTDPSKNIRPSRYSYTIDSERCTEYSVIEPVKIVCNLKEFHAVVDFMDFMNTPIHANFEDVGKPILFTYRLEGKLMLDIALMSQIDETDNNATIPSPIHVEIPGIREPTSSRPFGHINTPTQASQPRNTNTGTPSRLQQRSINSMTTTSPDTSPPSHTQSPVIPRINQPMENNYNMSSTESLCIVSRLENNTEEPLFSRIPSVNKEQDNGIRQSSSASQRLTTLQRLREMKRSSSGCSPELNMYNPDFGRDGTGSGGRGSGSFFPFDSHATLEPRSSRDTEGSVPYVKQENLSSLPSRPKKKQRPRIIDDSD